MFWRRAKSLVAAVHWTTAPQSSSQQPIHYTNYATLIKDILYFYHCYVLSMSLCCDYEKPVFIIASCMEKLGFLVGEISHCSWMQWNLLRSSVMSACNECYLWRLPLLPLSDWCQAQTVFETLKIHLTLTADFLSRFHNITEGWENNVPYLEQCLINWNRFVANYSFFKFPWA